MARDLFDIGESDEIYFCCLLPMHGIMIDRPTFKQDFMLYVWVCSVGAVLKVRTDNRLLINIRQVDKGEISIQ